MADMVKVTYTLDEETVSTIRAVARRRKKPQSLIVREAVTAYAAQEEKLADAERARRIQVIDALLAQPRTRPQVEVERELRDLRRSRRLGWRRPAD
jgi:hypothetical protein